MSDKWKSTIGLRFENYLVKYTGENIEAIKFNNEKLIDTKDLYPSLNVIRTINDDRNLRISYSKTTARPTFKEISAKDKYMILSQKDILLETLMLILHILTILIYDTNLIAMEIKFLL